MGPLLLLIEGLILELETADHERRQFMTALAVRRDFITCGKCATSPNGEAACFAIGACADKLAREAGHGNHA